MSSRHSQVDGWVLLRVEGYLAIDSGMPLRQICVIREVLGHYWGEYWAVWWPPSLSWHSGRTVHKGGGLKFFSNLAIGKFTLIVIFEIKENLVEILEGEGLEYLVLAEGVARHVSIWVDWYETSFFIDSISIFFSSFWTFIQNRSYNDNPSLSICRKNSRTPANALISLLTTSNFLPITPKQTPNRCFRRTGLSASRMRCSRDS